MNRNKIQIALSMAVFIATTLSSCMEEYLEGRQSSTITYQVLTQDAVTRGSYGEEMPVGRDSTSLGKMRVSVTATPFPDVIQGMTRGAAVRTPSAITSFGVCGAIYDASGTYADAACGSYFFNEEVTPDVSTKYFWPSKEHKLSFYAHWPYASSVFQLASSANALGRPSYTYRMYDDPKKHVDVMTAEVIDKVPDGLTVPITFAHRTAGVRFLLKNERGEPITLESISLRGMYMAGTLTGSTWAVTGAKDGVCNIDLNKTIADDVTLDITGTDSILFVVPQSCEGMTLRLVAGGDIYQTDLDGDLSAGVVYTYSIVLYKYDYFLNVTGTSDFTHEGGTDTYSIQSYKETLSGIQKPAAWKALYSTDGGETFSETKPSWITTFTGSGDGSLTVTAYDATVASQEVTSTVTGSTLLAAATPVADYDLSTNGGTTAITTANCYMVHAPGTYKLPLVYGNAITGGTTNTVAYTPGGEATTNYVTQFVNHEGADITDPWLKNNGAVAVGASLLWQDASQIVTSPAISGDYLTFTVPAATIAEGNAVIAVTDANGVILWSWHIWVTPETYTNTTDVATGSTTYTVAPVNLGWVATSSIRDVYDARECIVKIKQLADDGQEVTFTIVQTETAVENTIKTGYNPYYQWGRKDPFIPSDGNIAVNKTVYDVSGNVISGLPVVVSSATTTIGDGIQHPTTHYYCNSSVGYAKDMPYNLWDANTGTAGNISSPTVKTIYDPCPPGFCIPTSNLFSYIGNGGSRRMTTWNEDTPGAIWNIGTTGDDLLLPALGKRNISSGMLSFLASQAQVNLWSATRYSKTYGYYLNATPQWFYYHSEGLASGLSVRPVAE